jgi:hypothetical protein
MLMVRYMMARIRGAYLQKAGEESSHHFNVEVDEEGMDNLGNSRL